MEAFENSKFNCVSVDEARTSLELYGVAVIPSLYDDEECAAMSTGFGEFLEEISSSLDNPIKMNDPSTFKNMRTLQPLHSMLFQWYGIGHAQFVWDVRQNPKLADFFASFWNVKPEELLSSFDGASYQFPPEQMSSPALKSSYGFNKKKWLHVDQSFLRPALETVQGFVTANEVRPGDATFSFLESSHLVKTNIKSPLDWHLFTSEELEQFYPACKFTSIACKKGSLVLWDSRTVHMGQEALFGRNQMNTRCVVYTCLAPRKFATTKQLTKKREAFGKLKTTSHHPYKIRAFAKSPRFFTAAPNIKPMSTVPVLTALGKKLAGF